VLVVVAQLRSRDLDNGSKGKPWEHVFAILSLANCQDPVLLQTYTATGKADELLPFRVRRYTTFSGLGPRMRHREPDSTLFAADTEGASLPAYDLALTGDAAANSPTLLISCKIGTDLSKFADQAEYVFGSTAENKFVGMRYPSENKGAEGITIKDAGKNLAEYWVEYATGKQAKIRPLVKEGHRPAADFAKDRMAATAAVRYLIVSPRRKDELRWLDKSGDDGYWPFIRVIPLDSLHRIIGRFAESWYFQPTRFALCVLE